MGKEGDEAVVWYLHQSEK